MRQRLTAQSDKLGIERQDLAHPLAPHQGYGRSVDNGEGTFAHLPLQLPGSVMLGFTHPANLDQRQHVGYEA